MPPVGFEPTISAGEWPEPTISAGERPEPTISAGERPQAAYLLRL